MTLVAFATIYGFVAGVVAFAALLAAVFTKRWASALSIIAAISGSMAIAALVAATIIGAVAT